MKLKLSKWRIISVIPGIFVIVSYYTFTFISLALCPSPISPLDNWLSDLGNSSYNPNGAIFYNIGCILTGSALFIFYIGMYKFYRKEIWHKILVITNQTVGICSGFALIMLGLYSEDFMEPHMIWAGLFFWLNLIVLILANIILLFHEDFMKPISIYGLSVAGINVIFVIITSFSVLIPLLEWITVFTALGYVGLIVFNIYRKLD
ncbi:MAG: DUF998 domain-containing protein [Candidatus Hodarchaeota archaeon]